MIGKRTNRLGTTLAIALFGCVSALAHADSVRTAIESANSQMAAAVAKGDAAAVAAMYAADARVMPAGSEPVQGADAILKFWQAAISGVAGISLKTIDVFSQGSTATEVGQYELRDKSGKALDHGKYIVVWRNEGGKWKLLRDMFSTNVAPAAK